MSAQHTPGPWWVTDYGVRDSGGFICATTKATRYEGQEDRFARETAQREADALLIAAAPVMLKTLQDMDGWLANTGYEQTHPWRISLRATIAKATGSASS